MQTTPTSSWKHFNQHVRSYELRSLKTRRITNSRSGTFLGSALEPAFGSGAELFSFNARVKRILSTTRRGSVEKLIEQTGYPQYMRHVLCIR